MRLARALAALALAALALAACDDAPAPAPTAGPTVEPTAVPSALSPTPEAMPTATPSPPPSPKLSPTPAPTATVSPTRTPTASPTPTATPTLGPLPTREELGIREVDTAEALAEAELVHVRYAAGEEVPWEAGVFLLDVATGEVEGWTLTKGDAVDESGNAFGLISVHIRFSPSNRFLLLPGDALHDRLTGRTYATADIEMPGPVWDLVGWGSEGDERLVLWSERLGAYVVVDGEMEPVAQFHAVRPNLWAQPDGRFLMAHDDTQLQFFALPLAGVEPFVPSTTWSLAGVTWHTNWVRLAWAEPFDGGMSLIEIIDSETCRVSLYSAEGSAPVANKYGCWQDPNRYPPFISVSPDGRLLAIGTSGLVGGILLHSRLTSISIFDAITGEELLRIRGGGGTKAGGYAGTWLADSSGLVVGTFLGDRIVTLDGSWEPAPGIPRPGMHGLFVDGLAVRDHAGRIVAALPFGPTAREIRGLPYTRVGWGGTAAGAIRVHAGISYESASSQRYWPDAVIEQPPFAALTLVEVDAAACLEVREQPERDAPIVGCLPDGSSAVAGAQSPGRKGMHWLHIQAPGGVEGWASAEYLRWHSDGVRLEE